MKLLASMILVAMVLAVCVRAQVVNTGTKHFDKVGLAFDFPAEWTLIDKSADELQYFTVASAGSTTQISVIDQSASASPCDQTASKTVTAALLERIANQIHAGTPPKTTPVKIRIGSADIEGVQLHGLLNNQPVTGEVYSLQPRLVNLVYLRLDDDQRGLAGWETIRSTMTIVPTVLNAMNPDKSDGPAKTRAPIRGGVLNGKAVRLSQPPYPMVRASGTVIVQVLIDESGNVVSARAISGHPLLQASSVKAAYESKFSPTRLCGQPVRVTGMIQYNFFAR